jgi:hypothetical protein
MKGGVILFSAIIAIAGLYVWEQVTGEKPSQAPAASPDRVIEEGTNSLLRATAPAPARSSREMPTNIKPSSPVPPGVNDDATPAAPQSAPHVEFEVENLAWETRIEQVTAAAGLSGSAKAQQLLEMLPTLPAEALQRGTELAMQFLRDKDYALIRARLLDPQTHGMIASVLFADLLERPDEIALPALLAIARIPSHPYAEAARDNLELLLGKTKIDPQSGQWEMEIRHALAVH